MNEWIRGAPSDFALEFCSHLFTEQTWSSPSYVQVLLQDDGYGDKTWVPQEQDFDIKQ